LRPTEDALANYLKMTKRQQVIALLALGWSFRRIERETGVRRETISKYSRPVEPNAAKVFPGEGANAAKVFPGEGAAGEAESRLEAGEDGGLVAGDGSNPAKVFPGSRGRSRSSAARFREAILEKLDEGLTIQRVFQDLQEEYGYAYSYESVKRYVRKLARRRRAAGVMQTVPGEEAQVDFFQGAATLDATTGQWRRPWVFRMTLCHSRHGYEEAVWDQKVATFLRLHEKAFRELGGVVRVVRHDNLKAAVVRACLYDPDVHPVYEAFSKHWGFTALPTKPRNPQENGKQERSGGYVKSNALKGRRFNSLDEQNGHLRHWNRTIARLRIHGTTRRQVFTHYEETDKKALQPLAAEPFAIFERGTRTVHPDGHVEVDGAFYPVPTHLLGAKLEVRWDARLVRAFHGETVVAVHARVRPGEWARRAGEQSQGPTSSQRAYIGKLIGTCARVGPALKEWAEAAYVERGVRALRLIQGALHLVRKHPKEAVLHAARKALAHRLFRYKDLRRLTEQADSAPEKRSLLDVHEAIRPMSEYRLEDLL
jgi:transposase